MRCVRMTRRGRNDKRGEERGNPNGKRKRNATPNSHPEERGNPNAGGFLHAGFLPSYLGTGSSSPARSGTDGE